eukprot:jgi/Picsp_1/965/NSC_04449-R1_protein
MRVNKISSLWRLRNAVYNYAAMSSDSVQQTGPIQRAIEKKIRDALQPSAFSIVNDSRKHAGHSGNPDGRPDAETHFNLVVESEMFRGKSLVQQHRMIYDLLKEEFELGLHALALKTK